MADPVLVPATPTVRQGESIPAAAPAENVPDVQAIFDKVLPPRGPVKEPPPAPLPSPSPPAVPPETAPPTLEPPATPPAETPPTPADAPRKLPSFLEQQLSPETVPAAPEPDEMPEVPPTFTSKEEETSRYRKWRENYNAQRQRIKELEQRPAVDPQVQDRITMLETQNKELSENLSRFNVESNQEFQQRVIAPMRASWQEASRIVRDSGGDPQQLANALQLTGREQYDALDTVYAELPESAKMEVQNHVTAYKRLDEYRKAALRDAPRTMAELKKKDTERQIAFIDSQKKEMAVLFDNAVAKLRDEGKVEVLQKSNDPNDAWWNEQSDNMVSLARNLYLENSDLGKMAMACVLAPMADVYRKLFHAEREGRMKAEKTLKERFGTEPSLSESGGAVPVNGAPNIKEDLQRPFGEIFIRKVHELESQRRT